jgi:hypothetical protein
VGFFEVNMEKKTTLEICEYLKGKLPDGWGIHHPAGMGLEYAADNYILCCKKMNRNSLGVPIVLEGDSDRAAQVVLHTVWGIHENGYEFWESMEPL